MRHIAAGRVVHGALVGAAVLAAGWSAVRSATAAPSDRPSGAALPLALAFAALAGVAVLRALRAGRGVADLLLAAGLVSGALGWLYWGTVLAPLADPPYPSPADALWMARFPLMYVALAWHVGRLPAARRAFVLDILIGTAGITAAIAGLVVPAVSRTPEETTVAAVNAVYLGANVAHVLLLVGVVAMRRFRVPAGLWRQLAGAGVLAVTNTDYLGVVLETRVIPVGTVLSVGWLTGFALLVSGVGTPQPTERGTFSRSSVVLIPLTGAALALIVLVMAEGASAARWIAAGAVVVALGRMGLAFLEAEALAGSHRLALTDELTGLVNRRGLGQALRGAVAGDLPTSLVLLDLDRFKEVNDTLGHQAGDELLVLVGRRLTERVDGADGSPDLVARIGGDEFALVLRRQTTAAAEDAARSLIAQLSAVYPVGDLAVRSSATAGLVHLGGGDLEPGELLRRADVAMYAAKASGSALAVYSPALDTRSVADLDLVERAHSALFGGGLVLHYQPKVDLRTGAVTGVEALARLRSDGRLLMPGQFLPALDRAGELVALTAQVLDQAVAQAAEWSRAGHLLSVSVNVPAVALGQADFGTRVRDALERHGLRGRQLYLEVTEDSLVQDRVAARASLTEVRGLGVRVSVDDYGTGYSSLAYLKDLPLDEIKIDKSFVRGMGEDARATRIVTSTTLLAHGLDLTVVAEGVETEEDRSAAAASGCDLAQGYWYARPVPAAELLGLLPPSPRWRAATPSADRRV